MKPQQKAKEIAEKAPFLSNVPPDIRAHSYNAAMEMYKWTKEDMLKNLEVWEDYYLNKNSFKIADALNEIITWFRSPEDTEE